MNIYVGNLDYKVGENDQEVIFDIQQGKKGWMAVNVKSKKSGLSI